MMNDPIAELMIKINDRSEESTEDATAETDGEENWLEGIYLRGWGMGGKSPGRTPLREDMVECAK